MASLDIARDFYLDLHVEMEEKLHSIAAFMNRCGYYNTSHSHASNVRDVLHYQVGHRPNCPGFKTKPGWMQVAVTPNALVNDCVFPLYVFFPRVAALQGKICEFAALIPLGMMDAAMRVHCQGANVTLPRALGSQTCKIAEKFPSLPANHLDDPLLPAHDGHAFYTWQYNTIPWWYAHVALTPKDITDPERRDQGSSLLDITDHAFRALFDISLGDLQLLRFPKMAPGDFLGSSFIAEHKFHHTQAKLHTLLYLYLTTLYGPHFCPYDCEGLEPTRCWAFLFERSLNWIAFAQRHFYHVGLRRHPKGMGLSREMVEKLDWNRKIDLLYEEFLMYVREIHRLEGT